MDERRRPGPGITKVRHPHPVATRVVSLVRAGDGHWATLFDRADVVSEGAAEQEGPSLVYRGTTSIILRWSAMQQEVAETPSWACEERVRAVAMDPHLRLRAVRVAQREAQSRAPGMLGTTRMDLFVRSEEREVRIDVDVDAVVEAGLARMGGGA